MRTFVIGDVHGLFDELLLLFATLNPEPTDRFVFVGDLVDKGPDTINVLRYVQSLLRLYPGSVVVAGNHESKALERHRKDKLHKGEAWYQEATEDDWAFIKAMPLYHRMPELGAIAVHGGFYPRFFSLYPQGLDDERLLKREDWQKGGGKYVSRARRFQYTRYIDPETGGMLMLGEETDTSLHWAELYDGREGFAFFGHEPQHTGLPRISEFAIGIDTAAVSGQRLTAAVLTHAENDDFDLEFVSVEATEQTKAAYQQLVAQKEEATDDADV